MKIIIVGCGQVGRTLADELNREDSEVTIIDRGDAMVPVTRCRKKQA